MIIRPEKISTYGLVFRTDALFDRLIFSEVDFWHFSFSNEIAVTVEGGFWRLLRNNKIVRVSNDHQQKFGLPETINLPETITEILKGQHLKELKVIETTGDLILSISDNFIIEVFITSSGYESYSFYIDNNRYIGLGSGEIAVYNYK